MADYVVVPLYLNEQIDNYPPGTCFAIISIKLWITNFDEAAPFDKYFDSHIGALGVSFLFELLFNYNYLLLIN